MRALAGFLALSLTILSISGCLSDEAPAGDDDPARAGGPDGVAPDGTPLFYYEGDEFPLDEHEDHGDPALHAINHNMMYVGQHACTADGAWVAGQTTSFTDLKEWEDYIFVGQGDGFCILDISDPERPTFVSHFEAEGSADIDVSADGNWVFHAVQRNRPESLVPGAVEDVPGDGLPRGIVVVDVSDKSNPTFESYLPMPTNGVHTVHYHKHANGDDLVLLQTYDWVPPGETGVAPPTGSASNSPGTQRVQISRLMEVGGTTVLEPLSVFSIARPPTEPLTQWFPHDCTVQQHPFTDQTIMYCAYWDAGMVLVDISDPSNPQEIARYSDPSPSQYNQYHYVLPSNELIAGKHITVGAPELPVGVGESGYVRILDTTDPTNPVQLSAWTLPGSPGFSGGFLYSPHQFDIQDGKIYMGHNHAGTWVIDISTEENLLAPKSAGFAFPYFEGEDLPDGDVPIGRIWVAIEHRGFVYSSDTSNGVFVHHYAGDPIVVPAVMVAAAEA